MGDRGSLEKLVTRDEGLLQRDIVSADFGCVHLTRFEGVCRVFLYFCRGAILSLYENPSNYCLHINIP